MRDAGKGGRTNERPETDHVILEPMRGLKKQHHMAQTDKQTDRHGDSMTISAQLGQFSETTIILQ